MEWRVVVFGSIIRSVVVSCAACWAIRHCIDSHVDHWVAFFIVREDISHVDDAAVTIAEFDAVLDSHPTKESRVCFIQRDMWELLWNVVNNTATFVVLVMIRLRFQFGGSRDIRHRGYCDGASPVSSCREYLVFVSNLIIFETSGMALSVQEFLNRLAVQIVVVRCFGGLRRFSMLQNIKRLFKYDLQGQV